MNAATEPSTIAKSPAVSTYDSSTQPTEKFELYVSEIRARLKSDNRRTKTYAEYEQSLLPHSRFVTLNGTTHHYHDSRPDAAPDMPTVILIHGWDCWWMWWHKVIGFLNAKGVRSIAYDLKGHGWSDNDERRDYSLAALSEELHLLVERLGLKRYHLASFSLGSFVALDYATRRQDEIETITFFNFGCFPNNPTLSKIIPKAIPFLFDKIVRKLKWWPALYAYARLTLARNPATKEDIFVGMNSIRFVTGEAIQQTAEQLAKMEVTENLPNQTASLDTPILFVAGKGDQVVNWKNTKKLFERARRGRFELIKKCGHLITLELPERAADLIADHMTTKR